MNLFNCCRCLSYIPLPVVLGGVIVVCASLPEAVARDHDDWLYVFCYVQTMLLAAHIVLGPGRLLFRLPFSAAWGLAIGLALANCNLTTLAHHSSLSTGMTLLLAGTVPAIGIFALYRWRTDARLQIGCESAHAPAATATQFSMRSLLALVSAFAVVGWLMRFVAQSTANPFGGGRDLVLLQTWLGFYPALATAPVLLVIFRPSWTILAVATWFLALVLAEPPLFVLSGSVVFQDQTLVSGDASWDQMRASWADTSLWFGQIVVALLAYGLLARLVGWRLVMPDQSKINKPDTEAPSAEGSSTAAAG